MKNILHKLALSVIILTAPVFNHAHALEMSASGGKDTSMLNGVNARIEASEAVTTAAINSILKCNNKGKVYNSNPSATGKDADGCTNTVADVDPSTLTLKTSNFNVALPNCRKPPPEVYGWNSCTVTYNLKNFIGQGMFTDVTVSGVAGSYPQADPETTDSRAKTYPFSYDLGSLGANKTQGRTLLHADECSSETYNSYYSLNYTASSMTLSITGYHYNAGDKGRCFTVNGVRVDHVRITGQKLSIVKAD